VSDEERRVPHVRVVAVAGDFALVAGFPAYFLARLLLALPGGLAAQLGRYGLPPEQHADVLRAIDALRHAGAAWQLEQARQAASASGSDRTGGTDSRIRSGRGDALLTSKDVAVILGVTPRRVRMLAEHGGCLRGHRDRAATGRMSLWRWSSGA
jgi:hypothetical protein